MDLVSGLNASVLGPVDAPPIVFVHGFGCGQPMWRHVAPAFESDHRVVLFDLPGSAESDRPGTTAERHAASRAIATMSSPWSRELDLSDGVTS